MISPSYDIREFIDAVEDKDYLDIISQTGFEILEDNPLLPCEKEEDSLRKLELEIEDYFLSKYTFEELAIKGSNLVLKK